MMGHEHVYFFGGFLMMIFPLLFLVGLFLLLRRADRNGTPLFGTRENWAGHGPGHGPGAHHHPHGPMGGRGDAEDEAIRTLNNRLATGDIDPEDYRARVETLRTTRAQGNDPTAGMPYLGPEDQPGAQGPQV